MQTGVVMDHTRVFNVMKSATEINCVFVLYWSLNVAICISYQFNLTLVTYFSLHQKVLLYFTVLYFTQYTQEQNTDFIWSWTNHIQIFLRPCQLRQGIQWDWWDTHPIMCVNLLCCNITSGCAYKIDFFRGFDYWEKCPVKMYVFLIKHGI